MFKRRREKLKIKKKILCTIRRPHRRKYNTSDGAQKGIARAPHTTRAHVKPRIVSVAAALSSVNFCRTVRPWPRRNVSSRVRDDAIGNGTPKSVSVYRQPRSFPVATSAVDTRVPGYRGFTGITWFKTFRAPVMVCTLVIHLGHLGYGYHQKSVPKIMAAWHQYNIVASAVTCTRLNDCDYVLSA